MEINWLFTVIFLLGGSWETEAITGEVGEQIVITCSHTNADTNMKYFCKDPCHDEDILITSRETGLNSKYHLKEEGSTFNVTILDLKLEDSGTYWCGVDRVGVDTYNRVILTVVQRKENKVANLMSLTSKKMLYIGTGLSVVILVLVIVVRLFLRLRRRDISSSSGKDGDVEYAAPIIQNKRSFTTTPPVRGGQELDCRISSSPSSKDHTKIIYSNVSSEPQIQSDGLCYSSISFSKRTDCISITPQTQSTTYSALKIPTSCKV